MKFECSELSSTDKIAIFFFIFILLKKHGYTYAKPHNEATMITNGRANSIINFIFSARMNYPNKG